MGITMKIHIIYNFTENAWGGGNQFLKALRNNLISMNMYTSNPMHADAFLFNSHQQINIVELYKRRFNKPMIHRIDGPMSLYNTINDGRDLIVYHACIELADAAIFQSKYSRINNIKLGLDVKNKPYAIIHNAPDKTIFFKGTLPQNTKLKIISTSFSNNMKKGFDIYKYLDDTLDFNRFDYTFIGNSPIEFKNIKNKGVVNTHQLANFLREHSIFITASQNDPCSNSLLEAISVGLYPLALNSGGHPELIEKFGGQIFNTKIQLNQMLTDILDKELNTQSSLLDINSVTNNYITFIKTLL